METAKKAVRQWEAVKEQQEVLKGQESPSLEAVHPSNDRRKYRDQHRRKRGTSGQRKAETTLNSIPAAERISMLETSAQQRMQPAIGARGKATTVDCAFC